MGEVDRIPFTLNYNELTERDLFRKGSLREPFPDELRCMTLEEYRNHYQNYMAAAERPRPRPPPLPRLKDFILDGSQEIIYRNDTGNSFFFNNIMKAN